MQAAYGTGTDPDTGTDLGQPTVTRRWRYGGRWLVLFVWSLAGWSSRADGTPTVSYAERVFIGKSNDELWKYAKGGKWTGDVAIDLDLQEEALVRLGKLGDARVIRICRPLLVKQAPLPPYLNDRSLEFRRLWVRCRAADVLRMLSTPEARRVLQEAFEREVARLESGSDPKLSGMMYWEAQALRDGGDAGTLMFFEQQRLRLNQGKQWAQEGWFMRHFVAPLRARLVIEGRVPPDAKAVEALRVLQEEAAQWRYGVWFGLPDNEKRQVESFQAVLERAGLLAARTKPPLPLKALTAETTALLRPATEESR